MSLSWGTCAYPPQLTQQQQQQLHEKKRQLTHKSSHTDARSATLPCPIIQHGVTNETYPYEPSIASSASSSASSVFSDTASQTSSTSSTSQQEGDESSTDRQTAVSGTGENRPTTFFPGLYHGQQPMLGSKNPGLTIQAPGPIAADQRQHPRRCSLAGGQRPPQLVRQSDRKVNFVDNLVGEY
jgi:PHO85 cyclin-5